ncbi:YihY family inner membrane protein, partial [Myxococcota bacterium]|nr:YihY family inner membrane protein [Myxococcota bacterium]
MKTSRLGGWLDRRLALSDNPISRRLLLFARLTVDVFHHLVLDQAPRNAAALAYTTILSMVPMLAVSFALIKAVVPSGDMAQSVRDWMLGTLLADSVAEVGGILESFLERAQSGAVGLVGFTFLLFSALSAFLSAERAVNQIWRVPATRPLHRRLVTFYAVVTLTPALIGLGFVAARWVQSGFSNLTFGLALSSTTITWTLEAMALALMYKLLPHTVVKKRAAITGGVLAAIALELLKWGF